MILQLERVLLAVQVGVRTDILMGLILLAKEHQDKVMLGVEDTLTNLLLLMPVVVEVLVV
jgi:hypothetical protein